MNELTVQKVFEQIDRVDGLTPKNRNILRLLAEEMLSMAQHIIKVSDATFEVKQEGSAYDLCLCVNAKIGFDEREQLVAVSSKKENAMRKGVAGVMLAVLDGLLLSASYTSHHCYDGTALGYGTVWSMTSYIDSQPVQSVDDKSSELEKSIIVNFADDVIIGVAHNRLEMIVKKQF